MSGKRAAPTTETLTFHIMGPDTADCSAAFAAFASALAERSGIKCSPEGDDELRLDLGGGGLKLLRGTPAEEGAAAALTMALTLPGGAVELFQRLRIFLGREKGPYRLFSDARNCLVPLDPNLHSLDFPPIDERLHSLLLAHDLEPVYYHYPTSTFYAASGGEALHIVNTGFVDFLFKGGRARSLEELSYEVAPNIQSFGVLYSRGLIPVNFYEYYGRPRKILNYSFLQLHPVQRPLLLRPFICELHALHMPYLQISGEKENEPYTAAVHRGEDIDQAIRRVVHDELRLASDYCGAYVNRLVEFARGPGGALTPCLSVFIYVDRYGDPARVEAVGRPGWRAQAAAPKRRRRRRRRHKAESPPVD